MGGAMLHWISQAFSTYVLHSMHGNGYQWHSGPGANFGELTTFAGLVAFLRHKNCHQKRCWRIGHNHPEHGWPSCKRHYNDVPDHTRR
jgi:hypothetical protein